MRLARSTVSAVLVGLVLLAAMTGLLAWSRSGATFPYNGYGVNRLLDRLVADLNANDDRSIADLVSGETLAANGPPSSAATDMADSWISLFGGRGLHGAQYRWRRDMDDGMLTQVQVTAMTTAGLPISAWLTVTGFAVDDSHPNGLASRIGGPEQDARIGAAPLVGIPATDEDRQVAQIWIRILGGTGLLSLVGGTVLGAGRMGIGARGKVISTPSA